MKGYHCYLLLCLTQVLFIFMLKPAKSVPISATIHRTLDEEDMPRSTVRMAFGNGGSTQITAHSSNGAISSIHDAIDLHRQVKKTISNVRNLVRSRKQQRIPPSSAGRMNAYHPYARTGKPVPYSTGHMEDNNQKQYHPHLQHTTSMPSHEIHPHEAHPQAMHEISSGQGHQAKHQVLVQHPGTDHQMPHYSMAAEAPFRGKYRSQRAQHVQ
ncbi:uncharacterized protein FA14DRAFT_185817 [Meira miltonrushii]|uniref:Uncharacterized protein n=1 Tax=Meira miltonrushii TaxID=1280837 RepID=A0A316V6A9_9BASI|nr:uncharacterized protein FA14DRAFT_185817 [Meira miltonrushii]PWN33036.1 hypothetical protein FA14DRAFT_185817 [Meira miltonrushii]